MITIRKLQSGYWHLRGDGPCQWAQPSTWPCNEAALRASAFPEASEQFIRECLRLIEVIAYEQAPNPTGPNTRDES